MTSATTPSVSVEAHRVTFTKASEAAAQLGDMAHKHSKRLPELAAELALAMADADTSRIAQLRAERATIEAELRDIEPALAIAHQRVSDADRALAREELAGLFPEVAADYAAFVSGVDALNKLSSRMKDKARQYNDRYRVANLPDKDTSPLHPGYAMRLGHVAGHVEKYLRDFPGHIDITARA